MTPDDLKDYILKFMSAEEALSKLLKMQTDQYEKLKLGEKINPVEGQTINPLMILTCAAMDLGWDMILEKDQPIVRGIIVGNREYILEKSSQIIKGSAKLAKPDQITETDEK